MSPVVYWVVGSGTNVGKTTIAAALIRLLNDKGRSAIGFKPYAGSLLGGLVDFMLEKYPTTACKFYGMDAWTLATASLLTGEDCVDLVGPVQLLCYPTWQSTVLLRAGSAALDNVEYYCSDYGAELRDRGDFKNLAARTGLPFAEAKIKNDIGIGNAVKAGPEKPRLAFEKLLERGPDTIVCEGAGTWLPVWQDCPAVNHAFILSAGMVHFYPDIDLSFAFNPASLMESDALKQRLVEAKARGCALPLYLVEEKEREAVARHTVARLLAAGGLRPDAGPLPEVDET